MQPAQRTTAAIAGMLLLPALAACGAEQDDVPSPDCHHYVSGRQGFRECDVVLRDGRTVTCLRIIDEGISCDWDRTSHE